MWLPELAAFNFTPAWQQSRPATTVCIQPRLLKKTTHQDTNRCQYPPSVQAKTDANWSCWKILRMINIQLFKSLISTQRPIIWTFPVSTATAALSCDFCGAFLPGSFLPGGSSGFSMAISVPFLQADLPRPAHHSINTELNSLILWLEVFPSFLQSNIDTIYRPTQTFTSILLPTISPFNLEPTSPAEQPQMNQKQTF